MIINAALCGRWLNQVSFTCKAQDSANFTVTWHAQTLNDRYQKRTSKYWGTVLGRRLSWKAINQVKSYSQQEGPVQRTCGNTRCQLQTRSGDANWIYTTVEMATSGKPKQKNINKPKLGSAKSKEDIKVVKIDFNTWYRSLSFDNVYKMDENGNANGGSGDSETESDSDNTITWDDETHKKLDELDNLGQLEDYDGSSEGRWGSSFSFCPSSHLSLLHSLFWWILLGCFDSVLKLKFDAGSCRMGSETVVSSHSSGCLVYLSTSHHGNSLLGAGLKSNYCTHSEDFAGSIGAMVSAKWPVVRVWVASTLVPRPSRQELYLRDRKAKTRLVLKVQKIAGISDGLWLVWCIDISNWLLHLAWSTWRAQFVYLLLRGIDDCLPHPHSTKVLPIVQCWLRTFLLAFEFCLEIGVTRYLEKVSPVEWQAVSDLCTTIAGMCLFFFFFCAIWNSGIWRIHPLDIETSRSFPLNLQRAWSRSCVHPLVQI